MPLHSTGGHATAGRKTAQDGVDLGADLYIVVAHVSLRQCITVTSSRYQCKVGQRWPSGLIP